MSVTITLQTWRIGTRAASEMSRRASLARRADRHVATVDANCVTDRASRHASNLLEKQQIVIFAS